LRELGTDAGCVSRRDEVFKAGGVGHGERREEAGKYSFGCRTFPAPHQRKVS
jgi:hypothetical protein